MRKPRGISRKNWTAFCNWYKSELRMNPRCAGRLNKGLLKAFRDGWNRGYLEGSRDKYKVVD